MLRYLLVFLLVVAMIGSFAAEALAASLEIYPIKLEYELKPGQEATRTITAMNRGSIPVTVLTKVNDYKINENGVPLFEEPGDQRSSAGRWIKVETTEFELRPGQSKKVKIHLKVPEVAEPGGHYGAVLFRLGNSKSKDNRVSVGVVGQIAAVNIISIPGNVNKEGALQKASIPFFSSGYPVPVELTFNNTGNVHLALEGNVRIKDWFGRKVSNIDMPHVYVFPDSTKVLKLVMNKGNLFGFYKAYVSTKEKTFNDSKPVYFIVFPWTLLLGIFLTAIGIYALGKRQGKKAIDKALKASEQYAPTKHHPDGS